MTERHYKFAVAETLGGPPDARFQATFDDFDLDCKLGWGPTPEAAIIDLLTNYDLPKQK